MISTYWFSPFQTILRFIVWGTSIELSFLQLGVYMTLNNKINTIGGSVVPSVSFIKIGKIILALDFPSFQLHLWMYLEVCFFIIIYIRQYYWFSPCLAQLTLGESEGISWNFMELEETDFFFFFFLRNLLLSVLGILWIAGKPPGYWCLLWSHVAANKTLGLISDLQYLWEA